ncbi:MAG: hypothetical protein WC614_12410 [bacterium]
MVSERNLDAKVHKPSSSFAGSCEIGLPAPNRASYRRSKTELVVDGDLDTSKIIICSGLEWLAELVIV